MTEHTELPTWDQMSDLDKGAALMHLWKREHEGTEYAIAEYPVAYIEHPALLALGRTAACRHAATLDDEAGALPAEESKRLYELAWIGGAKIRASRKLWGVRFDNGNEAACGSEHQARDIVEDPSWSATALLHREVAGGDWTEVAS